MFLKFLILMTNIGFEEETYWDSPFEIRLHSFQIMILLLKNIAVCYMRCSFCRDLFLSLSDFNTHKMISNSVTVA